MMRFRDVALLDTDRLTQRARMGAAVGLPGCPS
jgi:hypothetical protein